MKKVSKMFALGLALAMTFGMTVSAAPSPTTQTGAAVPAGQEEKYEQEVKKLDAAVTDVTTKVDGVDVKLETKPVEPETLVEVENVAATKIAGDAVALGLVPANTKKDKVWVKSTTVVGATNVSLPEGVTVPKGGIELSLTFDANAVKAGKTYVLMHLNNGVWETLPAKVVKDGVLSAVFTSLSPVLAVECVIVEVGEGSTGSAGSSTSTSSSAPAVNADGTVASPKTGEALPVAGLMTVICLAGAVVCAKRVRYNK